MATKRKAVNISIPPELVKQFDEAAAKSGVKRSWVLQGCMNAYIRLIEKANGRTIHTLEFKGFEEKGDCIRTIAPSFLQVAGQKAGYGVGTSKTKELAKR